MVEGLWQDLLEQSSGFRSGSGELSWDPCSQAGIR